MANSNNLTIRTGVSKTEAAVSATATTKNQKNQLLYEDIEQSHHFLIYIDKLVEKLPSYYVSELDKTEKFLPVKSISYSLASFENMSIPLGVLGNLPILYRKNFGRLTMTLYDRDDETIQQNIQNWINSCFVGNEYVNYLSNIVGTMKYKSYNVKGQETSARATYYVMPADTVTINRSYEENGAKLIDFSVVVIGEAYS